MACKEYNEEMIFSYAAGELDGEKVQKLKEHIETCEYCREKYEECRALLSDVKESGEDVPEELLSGVMAKVREERKPKHTAWKKIALVAACIAILACVFAVSLNVGKTDKKADIAVPELMADEMAKEPGEAKEKAKETNAAPDGASAGSYDMYDKAEMICEGESESGDVCVIYCPYHTDAYHNIPQYLIAYVGDGAYEEWRSSLEETPTECPAVRLFDFIEYFDIPESVLRECYIAERLENEWDIDALCARDAAKWEAFCGKNG